MIILNLDNVEELVFFDKALRTKLPKLKYIFDQWRLSKAIPAMRQIGKKNLMDFLNAVSQDHISIMSEYFGDEVRIDKLDYSIVKNVEYDLGGMADGLNSCDDWFANFVVSRDSDRGYISFWR